MSIFFNNDEDTQVKEEESGGGGGDVIGKILLALLGVLLVPSIIIGWVFYYYILLRKLHQRRIIIFSVIALVNALALLFFFATDSPQKISHVFSHLTSIGDNLSLLTPVFITIMILFAGVIGFILVWWEVREMKRSPHNLQNPDHWMYKFEFARTPWELKKKQQNINRLKTGYYIDDIKAPIGLNEDDDNVTYRYYSEANKHTLITGGTGSGKTETMKSLIYSDIVSGTPLFVIDMKRSPEFASTLAKLASDNGAKFYHFVNGKADTYDIQGSVGQAFYDPLSSGSPSAKADMLLSMREYDSASAVYKSNMQQLLQVLMNMLEHADRSHPLLKREVYRVVRDARGKKIPEHEQKSYNGRDLTDVFLKEHETQALISRIKKKTGTKERNPIFLLEKVKIIEKVVEDIIPWSKGGIAVIESAISDDGLYALAKACEYTSISRQAQDIYQRSQGKTQINHALEELRGQIRTLTSSEYGEWLKTPTTKDGYMIDLFELSQKPKTVVMFSINSDSEPEFAKIIGTLIMQDLTITSARRRNKQLKNQVNVYVDEFQTLNMASVNGLLQKSRESRMAMTLSLQSLDQVVANSSSNGEAHLGDMLDTCSNFIVHAGATRSSAERFSRLLPKKEVEVYSTTNKHSGFMLSLNFSNKRNSIVKKDIVEKDVIDPSAIMTLSSPDENNNYKASAILINKTCSDPRYKTEAGGGLARKVHVILPSVLLDDYYIPESFLEENPPVPVFHDEPSFNIDDSGADGFDEHGDFFSEGLSNSRVESTVEDVDVVSEEADGGFTFEETSDEGEDPSEVEDKLIDEVSQTISKSRSLSYWDDDKFKSIAAKSVSEKPRKQENNRKKVIVEEEMPDIGF